MAQLIKNLTALQETPVRFLGQEDALEKGEATHSSILTWRIPWTVKSRTRLSTFHFDFHLPKRKSEWHLSTCWKISSTS